MCHVLGALKMGSNQPGMCDTASEFALNWGLLYHARESLHLLFVKRRLLTCRKRRESLSRWLNSVLQYDRIKWKHRGDVFFVDGRKLEKNSLKRCKHEADNRTLSQFRCLSVPIPSHYLSHHYIVRKLFFFFLFYSFLP